MSGQRFLAEAYAVASPELGVSLAADPGFDLAAHFRDRGRAVGRHLADAPAAAVDLALVSSGGTVLLGGWFDDSLARRHLFRAAPCRAALRMSFHEMEIPAGALIRTYRRDVKEHRGLPEDADLGFVLLFRLPEGVPPGDRLDLDLAFGGRTVRIGGLRPQIVSDGYLVSWYLGFFRGLEAGPRHLAACMDAYAGHRQAMAGLWQDHLRAVSGHALLDLAEDLPGPPAFSAVTVLYGSADLFHRQCATMLPAIAAAGGEAVVVCNSPELHTHATELCRYARAAFGAPVRLVMMGGNAGFSAANNVGVRFARSDRLLLLNPDILPAAETDWAALARRAAALGPREVTGAVLHYPDGTVMHAGMSVLRDPVPVPMPLPGAPAEAPAPFAPSLLRVEHPAKGAEPSFFAGRAEPFPVEAVTGGFLMTHRTLWEELGGLSDAFVFAYYEDADFCLRARALGGTVTVDPALRFVHLEGKGSGGNGAASGAMLYNRCLFTDRHRARAAGGTAFRAGERAGALAPLDEVRA